MSFAGQGFVVVQPSEEAPVQGSGAQQQQQGGLLGGLLQ
ncbi:AIM24 family protein, partial [Micromonospora sp. NPDC003776]